MRYCTRLALVIAVLMCGTSVGYAIPALINYQGILLDSSGDPITTTTSVEFRIWDMDPGGTELWLETQSITPDAKGVFTVLLGAVNPIPDSALAFATGAYLGVTVSSDPEMVPRAQLVAVAYAFRPGTVDGASGGTITSKVSIGPGHTNTGHHAFVAGEGHVAQGSYSTIAGGQDNGTSGEFASIGGGRLNFADGERSTVGGGSNNGAQGTGSVVAGGQTNGAGGNYSTVAGGSGNTAGGDRDAIGGGQGNVTSGESATIGGGGGNVAVGAAPTVAGGDGNQAMSNYSSVGGGALNLAEDTATTVSGGRENSALGSYSTVGGGKHNSAPGDYSVVAGGGGPNGADSNSAGGANAVVAGGQSNVASGAHAVVGGGRSNVASAADAVVGGGQSNVASGNNATIPGGETVAASGISSFATGSFSSATGDWTAVGGGVFNLAGGQVATVAGGEQNRATGDHATVPGGWLNQASGHNSFAAGRRAKANHNGAFVWGDGGNADVTSSAANQFTARTSGGARFFSNSALSTGVVLAAGGGAWAAVSDRNVKENVRPVDGRELLEAVAQLDISRWNYKTQDPSVEHIGPMAQDFYRLFGVGDNNRTITTIDPDGIALAAIQELHKRNDDLAVNNQRLESEVAELRKIVEALLQGEAIQ